jgi:hypothetical protein
LQSLARIEAAGEGWSSSLIQGLWATKLSTVGWSRLSRSVGRAIHGRLVALLYTEPIHSSDTFSGTWSPMSGITRPAGRPGRTPGPAVVAEDCHQRRSPSRRCRTGHAVRVPQGRSGRGLGGKTPAKQFVIVPRKLARKLARAFSNRSGTRQPLRHQDRPERALRRAWQAPCPGPPRTAPADGSGRCLRQAFRQPGGLPGRPSGTAGSDLAPFLSQALTVSGSHGRRWIVSADGRTRLR